MVVLWMRRIPHWWNKHAVLKHNGCLCTTLLTLISILKRKNENRKSDVAVEFAQGFNSSRACTFIYIVWDGINGKNVIKFFCSAASEFFFLDSTFPLFPSFHREMFSWIFLNWLLSPEWSWKVDNGIFLFGFPTGLYEFFSISSVSVFNFSEGLLEI